MTTKEEVATFLKEFKQKLKIWEIFYRNDRGKNAQTLLDLEISSATRPVTLLALAFEDYTEGPLPDTLHKGTDLWVFGKELKGKEVYIKITLGRENNPAICISFHLAERPMHYPLK